MAWAEGPLYRALGVHPEAEQSWKSYAGGVVIFSASPSWLPAPSCASRGNPGRMGGVTPNLAWNTAVSFITNTNWQAYSGESTMSYLSQMGALAVQNSSRWSWTYDRAGRVLQLAGPGGTTRRRWRPSCRPRGRGDEPGRGVGGDRGPWRPGTSCGLRWGFAPSWHRRSGPKTRGVAGGAVPVRIVSVSGFLKVLTDVIDFGADAEAQAVLVAMKAVLTGRRRLTI
ncbi:MAG: potassium-transporting ATPase subunit KdpA [Actinomycetota bacterium]|nr:potassium-transporting ATPase subunit KdpA [Actinomycetota bacterium]